MKFCTKCGAQNTDETQVCTQCQAYFIAPVNNFYNKKSIFTPNILVNMFGIINGVISIILGIITFTLSSLQKDTLYILEKEIGDELDSFLDVFLSSAKTFSFGMGSLLIIIGLFFALYFVNKIIQKDK